MPTPTNMDDNRGAPKATRFSDAAEGWIDLKDALVLYCRDANGLARDWHNRGPFPALVDIPDLKAWRFDPEAGILELWFEDSSRDATIKIAGPITSGEIEASSDGHTLSAPALADIEAGLSIWLQGYLEVMLDEAKAGHIELRGRPASLFALDQRLPDHVLPFLDGCDLRQGILTLSNGETVYTVRVRIASTFAADRESAERQAFLAALKKANVVKPRLAWLISKYRQEDLPPRAPGDFRDCEEALASRDKSPVKDERRRRSFGQARAWYRLVRAKDWWAEVAPILR